MNGEPIRAQPKPIPRKWNGTPVGGYAKARQKPLRRKTRLKARGKTSHARRPRDFEYMAEVAKLPCVLRALVPQYDSCDGPTEVDHAFGRYRKDSDRLTIPLCKKHHEEKTGKVGGRGFMAGWSLARRRGWLTIAVAVTQAEVARRREEP